MNRFQSSHKRTLRALFRSAGISFVTAVVCAAAVIASEPVSFAQSTETVIHNFVIKDGAGPAGDLVADSAGNLYGTTASGGRASSVLCNDNGTSGCGSVFELTPTANHNWLRVELYRFTGGWNDGYRPLAGLIRDASGNLFGTTAFGGHYGSGVVFELSPTSTGWTETVLYHFGGINATSGGVPLASLTMDSTGNLYGTTSQLGNTNGVCANRFPGCGTVFELSPSSSGWTLSVLYTFTGGSDGASPQAGLILDAAGNLYGTTIGGGDPACTQGSYGCGVVFELSPGAGAWTETVLHTFEGPDGSTPIANLKFDSAGNLYGTTKAGGSSTGCGGGCGVVFKLSPSASQWTQSILKTFQPGSTNWGDANGGEPEADLYLDSSGNLIGTTFAGGSTSACTSEGCGVVFELSPTQSGEWSETVLHSFSGGADGSKPLGGLIAGSNGTLIGNTYDGGNSLCTGGCGVVYTIKP